MKGWVQLTTLLLGSICFTSCATMIHGRRQEVLVVTHPAGATVSDGVDTWITPVKISLERKKTYLLTISKSGYHTQVISINRKVSAAVAGNIIIPFGFLVGWGSDAVSGAQWRLDPEKIDVELVACTTCEAVIDALFNHKTEGSAQSIPD